MVQPPDLLQLRGVSKRYRLSSGEDLPALDHFDLSVGRGEVVCIMGPSGCGKSTALHLAAGWLTPDTGEVLARGQRVVGPGPDRPFCYQENTTFLWASVRENVAFGLTAQGRESSEVTSLLEKVGLSRFADAYPKELSGGMMKRLELARAVASATSDAVLLLDESFASIDPLTRLSLHDLLRTLLAERGYSAILASHDPYEGAYVADRIVLMGPRPATVVEVLDVPLERTRSREMLCRADFMEFAIHVQSRLLTIAGNGDER